MKRIVFILILFIVSLPAIGRHVAGGELYYEYLGSNSPGTSNYRITLRLFRDCASSGPLLEIENVTAGIYSGTQLVSTLFLPLIGEVKTIALNTAAFPCLVGNVNVCYQVGIYSGTITLADNTGGYTLSRIGCCRVDRISNLLQTANVGSNYVTKIPGTNALATGHNSSPQFNVKDTALVCASKSFKLDFGAKDPDADSLSYSFCDAYTSGSGTNNAPPPSSLSLTALPYAPPFSGIAPLGSSVKINAATGIISGIAPPEGQYVVNVCITEWRNGQAFTEHRKDFILKVQNCDFIEAVLPEKVIQCKDFSVLFENLSTSSSVTGYLWDFGDKIRNIDTVPAPSHIYSDTGRFVARLTVTGPRGCIGSDSTVVYVYPGFTPGIKVVGTCFLNPFQFNDGTLSPYGTVNSWRWDFGDVSTDADTAITKNASYKYATSGARTISLSVSNTKGCTDSVQLNYLIGDKPVIQLPFRDTLICNIDSLPIPINSRGIISWTPNKNILFASTANPVVFPKDSTRYYVSLNDNGCIATDSVMVNVLPFIKVNLGLDTLICKTDSIRLHPISDALSYRWKSSSGTAVGNIKNPFVQPLVNTAYYVTANLGKCEDKDTVLVKVAPYPIAIAGPDTAICFGNRLLLKSTIVGSSISWSPAASLINEHTATPTAGPSKTTAYILRVTDTVGCNKAVYDTITVAVSPPVKASAGNDTMAIPNQPMQLNASGGVSYKWSPEIGLSNPSIANPVALLDAGTDSIKYKVRVSDANGCFADDEIIIRYNKTGPDIFVPTAFTPNADGKNDFLKPVTIGIAQLNYFRIYNRWGELVFSTTVMGKGWDGMYRSKPQPSNTYVFETEGIDYTGKIVFRKGTSVLIR
ncbi:MAG: hypothetical protein RLZZ28_2309 [Bacteroidota bacterium]